MTNQYQQTDATPARFIEVPEVSHLTSLKKTMVYEIIKKGELIPIKLGRKTVFLESEVIAWVNDKAASRTIGQSARAA